MDLEGQGAGRRTLERGYAMAALLVSIAVMGVLMSVVMPVWRQQNQREKEAELVFRGEQYARAIGLYQRKFPGAFPPSLDVLVQQRFLRKPYRDPMSEDQKGEFQILYAGAQTPGAGGTSGTAGERGAAGGAGGRAVSAPVVQQGGAGQTGGGAAGGVRAGIIGVASKSTESSIMLYKGRSRYSEWQFIYTAVGAQPGGMGLPGVQRPGMPQQMIDPRTGRPVGPGGMPGGVEIRRGTGERPPPRPFPGPGGSGPVRPPGRPPG